LSFGELNSELTVQVTSVTGHVFETDFPKEYECWDSVDPIALFRAPVVRVSKSGHVVKLLQTEATGVDYLVLWLDCDREGENICFEVMDCVKPNMARCSHRSRQTIFRAHFSAITPKDIQLAMENLGEPNRHESMAVEARQELDLKVGVAFSRFQTRYFQGKYADLDARCISYGPCQTPTLGFCVQRHLDIVEFCSEPFWTIDIKTAIELEEEQDACVFEWERGRIFDQTVCTTIHSALAGESYMSIYGNNVHIW
jgi:DNA topoisomerase III